MNPKIRVLIVDDSSVIRMLMTRILSSDPEIEVVGTASDPYVAREKLVELKPDVMTLDIEMPRMDGVTFLGKVMEHFPVPTIVISSLSARGSEMALKAMEAGAVDVMEKPSIDVSSSLMQAGAEIILRVKAVARANLRAPVRRLVSAPSVTSLARTTHQILAIASSTGGTEALKEVLPLFPSDIPGTVIVQHMPPVFTKAFAEGLQRMCAFEIKEAKDGDRVIPGRALLAPGNFHMELDRSGAYYYVRLHQQPLLHGVRPAADFLFRSIAAKVGANAIGAILTGMGKDGAEGLLAMKNAGSFNLAQDEKTCVVYGMPKAAIDCGAIHKVVPLENMAHAIIEQLKKKAKVA